MIEGIVKDVLKGLNLLKKSPLICGGILAEIIAFAFTTQENDPQIRILLIVVGFLAIIVGLFLHFVIQKRKESKKK